MRSKGLYYALASMTMLVADRLPASPLTTVLKFVGPTYITIDMARTARAGYLRRLPHWTRESWRRYLTVCAVAVAALLLMTGMTAAVDYHLPVAGASRSTQRAVWVAVTTAFMVVGAVGLVSAVFWLAEGDPTAQFTRFSRRRPATHAGSLPK